MMRLSEVAQMTHGQLHGADAWCNGVGSDTRKLSQGMLFVALQGPNFDGQQFLPQLRELGGAGALVQTWQSATDLPQVVVPDTLLALQQMAQAWRMRFDTSVIAVTGSCGKTTVKEMLASILAGVGSTLATQGNLNNHIGVPLTLLRIRPTHRFAVIEMGMSNAGEIDVLTRLASPQVALINNARPAHLENLGSLEAVARAKGEILRGLGPQGVAVINGDDPFADLWASLAPGRVLRFGFTVKDLDVRGKWQASGQGGELQICHGGEHATVRLALPGQHNGSNALAAATAAIAAGVADIERIRTGLEAVQAAPGRSQWRAGLQGSQVLDDTYNANPASLEAALQILATAPAKKFLVLGNMAELGNGAVRFHQDAGLMARRYGVDQVLALGDLAAVAAAAYGSGAKAYDDLETLLVDLKGLLMAGAWVLVKGSRSARMERVVEAITE